MSLENIERTHTILELLLAVAKKYCEKHRSHPDLCGATQEARELLGKGLKVTGGLIATYGLLKCLDSILDSRK